MRRWIQVDELAYCSSCFQIAHSQIGTNTQTMWLPEGSSVNRIAKMITKRCNKKRKMWTRGSSLETRVLG